MLKTRITFNLNALLRVACCGLFTLMLSVSSYADSQRYLDYQYDGAGNIVSIITNRNLAPPSITSISPAFIHREANATVTVIGVNLYKATASVSTPGLSITDSSSISDTEMVLILHADSAALIGNAPIVFTTPLGSDTENIAIADRAPIVSTNPNPVLLSPNSSNVGVTLSFDQPFQTDQTYDLKISDTSIATVSQTQFTLLAGQTEVFVFVSAQSIGATGLEITQLSNFLALNVPVYVLNDTPLPPGSYPAITQSVGVVVALEPAPASPSNTGTVSPSVGVVVALEPAPASPSNTGTVSPSVGVVIALEPAPSSPSNTGTVSPSVGVVVALEPAPASPSNTGTVSPSVGVIVALEPAPASPSNTGTVSPSVGVSYGVGINSISPQQVSRGSSHTLVINGLELDTISAIAFTPNDVTAQAGSIVINPAGTQLTVTIDVPSNASIAFHNLIFSTPAGDVSFGAGYIDITN